MLPDTLVSIITSSSEGEKKKKKTTHRKLQSKDPPEYALLQGSVVLSGKRTQQCNVGGKTHLETELRLNLLKVAFFHKLKK